MVIFHSKFDFVTYIPQFLNLFGAQQNQIGVKKKSKLPISLKSNSQMHHICICRSFLKEIRWCHSFLTKCHIRPLWGTPGPMGSKDVSMYKYVYVQALFSKQKLHDASRWVYLISLVFWTKYMQCWVIYLEF